MPRFPWTVLIPVGLGATVAALPPHEGPIDRSVPYRMAAGNAVTAAQAVSWRLEPDLRIGADADSGPTSFTNIITLEVDAAGRIYALEHTPREIRVFRPDGTFLRRLGRLGSGPGEFREAFGLAWDSLRRLMVVDHSNSRYTFFDTSGSLAGSTPREQMGVYGWRWEGGVLRDGRVVEYAARFAPGSRRMLLLVLGADGRVSDSLNLPQPAGGGFYRIDLADGYMVVPIPFAPQMVWRLDARGYVWLGTGDRYRLAQVSLRGDTVRLVERRTEPVRVHAAEVDSLLSQYLRRAPNARVDRSRVPATKPAFTDHFTDDVGWLWVSVPLAMNQPGVAFDVFDPRGRYRGRVTTPERIRAPVLVRGSRLYAVVLDDDEVTTIVRFRIVGR